MTIEQAMDGVRNRIAELEQQVETLATERDEAREMYDNLCVTHVTLTARVRDLEEGLKSIAIRDQDERPLPGADGPFDWRRRSMWQEEKARALLTPTAPASEDKPVCGTCEGTGMEEKNTGCRKCDGTGEQR